jgi:tetratricopeptide (TPR) repeat protein
MNSKEDWFAEGNALYYKGQYEEALYKKGQYEDAIGCYDKAIELDPDYSDAWYNKGLALYNLRRYEEAILCYEKVIELKPDDSYAWNNKGFSLKNLGRYADAIVCYDKAIELKPDDLSAWNNKGISLDNLGRYEEAIECYEKAIELKPYYFYAWSNKGISLDNLGLYADAIVCYDKAIKLKPYDSYAWNNKGVSLYNLGHDADAIVCYDKAIELKPDYYAAWNNKGLSLKNLGRYADAIECFDNSIELLPEESIAWNNKGESFCKLNKYQEAIECFKETGIGLLAIIVRLGKDMRKEAVEVVKIMLDNDPFFKGIVPADTQLDVYKNIYIKSLLIISLLHITRKEEGQVAHYTKRSASKLLLFDNSPLRLHSITTSNDPEEGKVLLDFLGYKKPHICLQNEMNRAFGGSFILNHDSLNQFRLYGKENNEEATGVSIVVRNSFFSNKIERSTLSPSDDSAKKPVKAKDEVSPRPLFRCIYIDPSTGHIASVGHREEYTFHRDEETLNETQIGEYNTYIQEVLSEVRTKMDKLKEEIARENLDEEVVSKLLINLRYLIKHVAFKEEQECRIIRIAALGDANTKVGDNARLYIEYLSMLPHTTKICFGPKATGIDSYKDALRHKGYRIDCIPSEAPFA